MLTYKILYMVGRDILNMLIEVESEGEAYGRADALEDQHDDCEVISVTRVLAKAAA